MTSCSRYLYEQAIYRFTVMAVICLLPYQHDEHTEMINAPVYTMLSPCFYIVCFSYIKTNRCGQELKLVSAQSENILY